MHCCVCPSCDKIQSNSVFLLWQKPLTMWPFQCECQEDFPGTVTWTILGFSAPILLKLFSDIIMTTETYFRLPNPGIEHPGLPHCRRALYRLSHQGSELKIRTPGFAPLSRHLPPGAAPLEVSRLWLRPCSLFWKVLRVAVRGQNLHLSSWSGEASLRCTVRVVTSTARMVIRRKGYRTG